MSLSSALAIWGALTGSIGAVLGVLSFRRDRARLLVSGFAYSRRTGDGIELRFRTQVINEGRQPIMVSFLMVGTPVPRSVSARMRLVYAWARIVLPLIVRDPAERAKRFTRAGKWVRKGHAMRLVQLASPKSAIDGETGDANGGPDLPAVVKPGEILTHDRALNRKESEAVADVRDLQVIVVDARYRRIRGPMVLPKLHKATPWNTGGWIGTNLAENQRDKWLRLVDKAFPTDTRSSTQEDTVERSARDRWPQPEPEGGRPGRGSAPR